MQITHKLFEKKIWNFENQNFSEQFKGAKIKNPKPAIPQLICW